MSRMMGIDFGTTNSAVALCDRSGVRVVPGANGEPLLPSAVYIDASGAAHVGESARNVALLYPDRTVLSVKRALGNGRSFQINGASHTPESIASCVFRELRDRCEQAVGEEVRQAVVSVPAYFDERKRQGVEEAARLAGLDVMRLINEPTAAALAHRIEGTGTILVYDLGGGTFDVSVLHAEKGVFRVLASRGDARLGSDDFDRKIIDRVAGEFLEETGIDLLKDRLAVHKLRAEAERAKITLSERREARIEIPFIATNASGACHLAASLTREELEALVRGYVDRTIRLTKGALADAGIEAGEIDHLLLVGGPTHMPMIRAAVGALVGREPEQGVDPELAVVRGAATQAGIIAGVAQETLLVDVTPLGLGVRTADDRLVTLVPRNTVLPVRAGALFTTVSDNQRRARIAVLQGEHALASENITLGSFDLEGIQGARKGVPEIEVTFDIDVDGILTVTAKDLGSKSESAITLEAPASLDEQAIQEAVVEARAAEIERALFGGGEEA